MAAQDKLVVLTGTTRGLGRAMAEGFAASGWTVLGCGISQEGLLRMQQQLPPPHQFEKVDVSRDTEVQAWADKLLTKYGPPALVVNNAGLINKPANSWDVPADTWRRLFKVNVLGMAWVIRAFVPAMVKAQRGVIVNFSSTWGRTTSPEVAPYCATKYAVEGLTQSLAQELPKGMAAVALNPGVIDTDMLKTCFGESASAYQKPKDWARKAVPMILSLNEAQNGKSISVG